MKKYVDVPGIAQLEILLLYFFEEKKLLPHPNIINIKIPGWQAFIIHSY